MVELTFTPNAEQQYKKLPSSQQDSVDYELNSLKREGNDFIQHVANTDMGISIIFERTNSMILITDIINN